MALNAKKAPKGNGGGNRIEQEPMDAGTYPARLVQVIDLGVQPQRPYQGQEKPPKHMIMTTYEFLDEFIKDEDGNDVEDKPRWLSEDFPFNNLEQDKAKSTIRYYALDPECVHDGDWTALVETPCTVTVVQNKGKGQNAGKTYNNIASVAPMRSKDAAKAKPLVNPPKVFVLDEPDMEVFKSLPEYLQTKIKSNLNYQGSRLQKLIDGGSSDVSSEEEEDDDKNW